MSFDWGSRPTDYGRGGDIDMDLVYNDPRFATAVTDAIKQSPTMRSAFPHSSIDPRAIYPVQRVTTLPNARERYEGLEVEYCPTSLTSSPVWRCVWRSAMNSGSGAWAVVGGAPLAATQSAFSTQTTASLTTEAAMTNSPSLTAPVGGIYLVSASGNLLANAGPAECRVGLSIDGGAVAEWVARVRVTNANDRSHVSHFASDRSLTSAQTVSLRVATDNTSWSFGENVAWRLLMLPVELRP